MADTFMTTEERVKALDLLGQIPNKMLTVKADLFRNDHLDALTQLKRAVEPLQKFLEECKIRHHSS